MSDIDLKKYRYEMRNEFIGDYRTFHDEYEDLLYYLGMDYEDNLADIIRDRIWKIAEIFDEIDYNYFFQTEICNTIIVMLSAVLIKEEEILSKIDERINISYAANLIYFIKKNFITEDWIIKYRKLCEYYKNITIDDIIDEVILKFQIIIKTSTESEEVKSLLINDFKEEIDFLISKNKVSEEHNKVLKINKKLFDNYKKI